MSTEELGNAWEILVENDLYQRLQLINGDYMLDEEQKEKFKEMEIKNFIAKELPEEYLCIDNIIEKIAKKLDKMGMSTKWGTSVINDSIKKQKKKEKDIEDDMER